MKFKYSVSMISTMVLFLFALLGLCNIIPDHIALPVVVFAGITKVFAIAMEYKRKGNQTEYYLFMGIAVLGYLFFIYMLFEK